MPGATRVWSWKSFPTEMSLILWEGGGARRGEVGRPLPRVTLLREDVRWQQHFSYGGCQQPAGAGRAAGLCGTQSHGCTLEHIQGVPPHGPLSPRHPPCLHGEACRVHASGHCQLEWSPLVFIFSRRAMDGFNKKAVKRYCIGNYHWM